MDKVSVIQGLWIRISVPAIYSQSISVTVDIRIHTRISTAFAQVAAGDIAFKESSLLRMQHCSLTDLLRE